MTFGNIMLYIGFFLILAFIILIEQSFKTPKNSKIQKTIYLLSKINASIFTFLLTYLSYLFLLPDFTTEVVWRYTKKSAPTMFKLMGIWAGQSGTYLLWTAAIIILIFILFKNTTKLTKINNSLLLRIAQITAISALILLTATIFTSPFDSIYDVEPELPQIYVPSDGNGLNSALLNLWILIHPPILFLAYALLTIPFAASILLLIKKRKNSTSWVEIVKPWLRYSWLFLTLSLAFGGLWAYEILGWGGYWAWDPVETSSLLPWILLTAALHLLGRMHDKTKKFTTLAPALISTAFLLVLYSTFITRSSLWGSIHSFEETELTTSLKIILIFIITSAITILTLIRKNTLTKKNIIHLKNLLDTEIKMNMDRIYYVVSTIFILLMFVSLFGITYPFIYELIMPQKLAITTEFYNFWSYLLMLPLIILTGYGMSYALPEKKKNKILKTVIILTLIFAFIKPDESYSLINPTSLFYDSSSSFYKTIGDLSILSMVPPLIYLFISIMFRIQKTITSYLNDKRKNKPLPIKTISTSLIHLSVFLIIFSVMFTPFTTSFETKIKLEPGATTSFDDLTFLEKRGNNTYQITLVNYDKETIINDRYYENYIELHEVVNHPLENSYNITTYGTIINITHINTYSYILLENNNNYLWLASTKKDYRMGDYITATGDIMFDFTSPTTKITYPTIMFAEKTIIAENNQKRNHEMITLDIYQNKNKITKNAILKTYNEYGGELKVKIDKHLFYDVYITHNGSTDEYIYLSVKIFPFVSFLWLGILLFAISITAIIITDKKR